MQQGVPVILCMRIVIWGESVSGKRAGWCAGEIFAEVIGYAKAPVHAHCEHCATGCSLNKAGMQEGLLVMLNNFVYVEQMSFNQGQCMRISACASPPPSPLNTRTRTHMQRHTHTHLSWSDSCVAQSLEAWAHHAAFQQLRACVTMSEGSLALCPEHHAVSQTVMVHTVENEDNLSLARHAALQ
eukprot:1158206-Pelagomonas_calceolata.AAC.5